MTAFALSAALVGLASAGPASAFSPSTAAEIASQPAGVSLVDYKPGYKKGYKKGPSKMGPHKYSAGGHYKHAPGGWHRFDKRPGDWRTRGCIIVGPIWWCP